MVDADLKAIDPQSSQQIVNHQHHLDIGHRALSSNGIKVALDKLSIASRLRIFAAPHRGDMVPFERRPQLAPVLCGKASQRDGQIESHPHFPTSVVGETVHLAIGFFAPFAGQNLQVFERRRIDR